jgi:hypothetical protein
MNYTTRLLNAVPVSLSDTEEMALLGGLTELLIATYVLYAYPLGRMTPIFTDILGWGPVADLGYVAAAFALGVAIHIPLRTRIATADYPPESSLWINGLLYAAHVLALVMAIHMIAVVL